MVNQAVLGSSPPLFAAKVKHRQTLGSQKSGERKNLPPPYDFYRLWDNLYLFNTTWWVTAKREDTHTRATRAVGRGIGCVNAICSRPEEHGNVIFGQNVDSADVNVATF